MYTFENFRLVRTPCFARARVYSLTLVLSISMIPQAAESEPPPVRPSLRSGENNWIPLSRAAARAVTTQDLNSGLTPADLVTALLGSGVAVSNVTFTGANTAAGKFAGGTGIIGFESGIMLSSGDIAFAAGPNTQDDVSGVNAGFGDPDLDGLIPGYTTFDACILEFDFQCTGTQVIQFQYVFTSEEYNEWVNSPFNDVFGFFLNGQNIALVPGSPGTPVSINNVNCDNPYNPPAGSFCNLFINNDCNDIPPGTFPCTGVRDIQMDGMIVILTATGSLSPGMNHIKLALADAGDQVLDSNVFIRAQSFTCGDPAGACCDTGTQSCTDNVTQTNCQGAGMEWTVGLACNQLNPPCTTGIHPDGTNCANPIPINSLPFVESNTTSDKANDYTNSCLGDYDNGLDILYELVIPATQCVDITVTGATPNDNWIGVALDSACPPGTGCIAQGTSQAAVATITNLTLAPGVYYLMIDRWPLANDSLNFTLNITDCSGAPTGACCNAATQVCTDDVLEANCQGPDDTWSVGVACGDLNPPCAPEIDPIGQDCQFPIFVTSIPFDDVNTTADKKEDYANTCLGVFDDGDDIVYEITLTSAHCVDITVAGATAIDHSIGVVLDDVCPPGLSCLAQASTTGTVATIDNLLLDPGTYYFMVDRQPDDEGFAVLDFRLTIAECPAASGACCLPSGQCAQVTEADCTSAGGLTWTTDTPCSPNPCCGTDADFDGLGDLCDNCPGVANANQADCNMDGQGDLCETAAEQDDDADGLCNAVDNCPSVANLDQTNTDGDPNGDACDPDDDNDGVADDADPQRTSPDICGDTDGDTCDDCAVGTDNFGPLADNNPANDGPDADADGLCNAGDNCPLDANPTQEDCDGNGVGDACQYCGTCQLFGDLVGQFCLIDVDDLLCALDSFSGTPMTACGEQMLGDIVASGGGCGPDGVDDVDDLLAVVGAFSGVYACPPPCPAGGCIADFDGNPGTPLQCRDELTLELGGGLSEQDCCLVTNNTGFFCGAGVRCGDPGCP